MRCFEDTNIIHVDGSIDPARDIETINLELIFSDIEILDRRIAKIAKQARMDKTLAKELELVEAVKAHLEDGKMARTFEVPDDDDAQIWFKGYNLLTAKPTIYAANVAEDDLVDDGASNPHVAKVREMAKEEGAEVFVICAQIEQELSELSEEEKKEYLDDLGVASSGLDKLVAASYRLLGLISFLPQGRMSVVPGRLKKERKHHRQLERSIPILSVDLSKLRLSIIRICWIMEVLQQPEKKESLAWKEKIMWSKMAM